ncbi:uncharacterized protein LALA0_S03e09208g [Lachancea lanzarotensis]|uniref:LALA0S03e09208g1_1 n=1 Tax=Lachancea lanzarotensis TaxID=1245769 RepID=A0A0C7MVV8_9SACH|nr:uncharacterized protein LALA0_S03e09208g [Lachancea lanzarotensis]CEP61714.1 LALA0S03e09208g1_1 [Lachancea lanzarotensis]
MQELQNTRMKPIQSLSLLEVFYYHTKNAATLSHNQSNKISQLPCIEPRDQALCTQKCRINYHTKLQPLFPKSFLVPQEFKRVSPFSMHLILALILSQSVPLHHRPHDLTLLTCANPSQSYRAIVFSPISCNSSSSKLLMLFPLKHLRILAISAYKAHSIYLSTSI